MNISEIHNFINLIVDQEQAGYFPPADIDTFLDRASMWAFNKYRAEYATSIEAYEAMAPFKATALDFATNGSGVYTVASNLNYNQLIGVDVSVVDAGTGQPRRWPVEIIKEDELPSRRNSQLLTPSSTQPIALETGPGIFKFYPEQIHAGTLRFFRRPVAPVFGYTQTGRTITYDSGNSTQLEWTEPYLNKVVFYAINLMGINLDNQMLQKAGVELPAMNV